jgi:hypothetical protein
LPPNTVVPYDRDGMTSDIDISSTREGVSPPSPTRAIVTSRSHHGGVVTVAMMDTSVTSIAADVDAAVCWALGSRAGGEAVTVPR